MNWLPKMLSFIASNEQISENEAPPWLKSLDTNCPYIVTECTSNLALNRIFVQVAILSYLDLKPKIIVLDSTDEKLVKVFDSIQTKNASYFVESLIDLMSKQNRKSLFYDF